MWYNIIVQSFMAELDEYGAQEFWSTVSILFPDLKSLEATKPYPLVDDLQINNSFLVIVSLVCLEFMKLQSALYKKTWFLIGYLHSYLTIFFKNIQSNLNMNILY